jgi:hypothetical protein
MMGLFDGLAKSIIEQYLNDQVGDFRAWFEAGLEGIDPGELSLRELGDIAVAALKNTLLHGSPPAHRCEE